MPDTRPSQVSSGSLPEIKISELPVATSANTTDQLEANQAGVTRSITVAQIAALSPPPDLSDYVTDEELAAAIAGIPPPPTTLPPSGAAGGDLAGSYPSPTIKASVGLTGTPTAPTAVPSTASTTQIATTAFVQSALPTTLPGPPTGSAGGGLSGSYPNPTIRPSTTNGDVLTTVAGVSAWAAPTGGGGTATLATGAVGYGSASNVLTGVLADFSWDATNKRLGVGTSTPGALADFNSTIAGQKVLNVKGTTTSASQNYFDVVLVDPTGGSGSAMRVMGGATGISPLYQVDRAGDTQVSGWQRALSLSSMVTNGADYFAYYLGNGAGGNIGLFAGLSNPTFSTFGRYGSLYLDGNSPGLPYYNNNGSTGWDRLVGETSTQTLTNKSFAPASISPGSNGQVLTTVSGAAAWAAASGGASITVSDTPPATPSAGALWWNSVLGTMFIYFNDGNSTQWVPAAPSAMTAWPGATGGQTFLAADVALNATGTVFNVLNTGSIGAAGQIFDIEIHCHTLTSSGAGNPDIGIHDGTNYLAVARLSASASSIARCSDGISVRVTLAAPTTFTFKAQDAANTASTISANAGSPGPFSTTGKATYIKWTRAA